ncbi:uncharacterized protein LOC9648620 [Selaginella moellendorffii]|uniref:uncharacterized protein LOC9648620 n=1 Tax=Selaginella moellendorffii TaxID=88036 RepID=UPI000D1C96A4|nr:uncharacterized protein LOC9648620 [Selaginella moellendorffii]|eukprot:XP_024536949.1 uncharacterized protein LOC9648620 [Selaginella moellendorffii]
MAPKGKKGKKGGAPKPDSGWQKALGNFKWERPLEALPDPAAAPNFGEIRATILHVCQLISILWSSKVNEAFIDELFRASRPSLEKLELRGATSLARFVMPDNIANALKELDLSCCTALEYVFLEVLLRFLKFLTGFFLYSLLEQSSSLEKLSLARCGKLRTGHIVARGLKELNLHECNELVDLMFWSDNVLILNPPYKEKDRLELYCPELKGFHCPPMKIVRPIVETPPPLKELLEHDKVVERYEIERNRVLEPGFTGLADFPKTPYLGFNSYRLA